MSNSLECKLRFKSATPHSYVFSPVTILYGIEQRLFHNRIPVFVTVLPIRLIPNNLAFSASYLHHKETKKKFSSGKHRFFDSPDLEVEMERDVENKRIIRTELVWISGAAVLLLVFFCTLAMIAGSWTLRVECNQVTISMEINAFDDSFLELRIKNGSHHTKEEMDAQKDRLDIRYDDLRPPSGLWALDGRRQLQSQD